MQHFPSDLIGFYCSTAAVITISGVKQQKEIMGIWSIPLLNGNAQTQKLKLRNKKTVLNMHQVDFHTSNILST